MQEAIEKLRIFPFEDLGYAKLDHHRSIRTGFPEVIYAPGKTDEQIREIAHSMFKSSSCTLVTKAEHRTFETIIKVVPNAKYNSLAKMVILNHDEHAATSPGILVIAAGTSDLPVAEEAAITAEVMGNSVERLWDVGVAGLHRLLQHISMIQEARVIVVVAGMEGALPSVVGGLVSSPVIAVPTSVGYGANFQGLSALLSMLNACSPGIAVVNIDNGFGGGYMAATINLSR